MKRIVVLGIVFAVGILIGLALWNSIALPYSEPLNTSGVLAKLRLNPNTNTLRYLVFLITPTLLLAVVALAWRGSRNWLLAAGPSAATIDRCPHFQSSNRLLIIVSILILAFAAHYRYLENPNGAAEKPGIDHFHDGDMLAATVAWEAGLTPYQEFGVFRGVGQDAISIFTAFQIFGRNVAGVHTFSMLYTILVFVALAGLFVLMFPGNYLASLALAAVFYLSTLIGYMTPSRLWERDLLCILFLAALLLIYRFAPREAGAPARHTWLVYLSAFMLTFLSPTGFALTHDRGYFLTAVLIIIWPLLYFVILRRSPVRLKFALASVAGLLVGILILGLTIRWAFAEFFRYVFVELPSYKEFVDGLEFEINSRSFRASGFRAFIVTTQAAALFWLAYRLMQTLHREAGNFWNGLTVFIKNYFVEISFVLMATVVFRYALGRADSMHVSAAGVYYWIFIVYVAIKYYLPQFIGRPVLRRAVYGALIVVLIGVTAINSYRFVTRDVASRAYQLGHTDSEMLTDEYRQTLAFLEPRVSDQALFVTLTNEGSWYYLLDRPSPLFFAEVLFGAGDTYQRKMVAELETKPVMYVLYRNDAFWNNLDKIPTRERTPLLFDYVDNHFHFYKRIGSQEIWIRNGFMTTDTDEAAMISEHEIYE